MILTNACICLKLPILHLFVQHSINWISKIRTSLSSGTTIETISVYKYVLSLLKAKDISLDYRFATVTDDGSKLEAHAKTFNSFVLHDPVNVGGRFSVLSAAGLAPLIAVGVDIQRLLVELKRLRKAFEDGYIKDHSKKSNLLR